MGPIVQLTPAKYLLFWVGVWFASCVPTWVLLYLIYRKL